LLQTTFADVKDAGIGNYRRAIRRWQAENDVIVDSALRGTEKAGVSVSGDLSPAATSPPSLEEEFDTISNDLSRDVTRLSMLRYQIAIEAGLPIDEALTSETLQTEVSETHYDFNVANEVPSVEPPSAEEANVVPELENSPEAATGAEEPALEDSSERESAKSEQLEPVTYTPAATAALPVYDADAVAQRDLIGVEKFVDAFSYLIAARTMQPPLAVGLFGHWGSGKTFLMRSIQRRVDQITRGARESKRAQAEIGVYRRVVQIEFNAWHYVEGNLWASLVDHIFANLRTSIEEGGSELDRRRRAITKKLASTRQEQLMLAQRIKQLDALRKQKQSTVDSLESEQRKRLQEAEKLRIQDVAAVATLDTQDIKAVDSALSKVGINFSQKSAVDAAHGLDDARAIVVDGNAILAPMRQYGWRWAVLLVIILLVAPVTSGIMSIFRIPVPTQVLSSIAAFLSSAAFVASRGARWTSQALKEIEDAHARVRKRVEQASAEQARRIAALKQEIDVLDRKLTDALRERDKADSEIGDLQEKLDNLTPGKLLAEFLEQRSTSGDYRKYLGLTALIRRDFEELSRLVTLNNEALLSPAPSTEKGVADFNRVVLYVDDLDRCPPRRVVEVLQAIHLLLSFPIFVVVLAVDPRWLAQSLSSEYPDLLGSPDSSGNGNQATPDDYLEKIFQIPFRLAPLDIAARARFVEGLLEPETAQAAAATSNDASVSKVTNGGQHAASSRLPAGPSEINSALTSEELISADNSAPSEPAIKSAESAYNEIPPLIQLPQSSSIEAVDLNPASLRFTKQEVTFLEELLPLLETSPRSIKRYINIYRLIKSVAGITGLDSTEKEPDTFRCAMLMLALQTGFESIGPALVRVIAEYSAAELEAAPSHLAGVLELMDTKGKSAAEAAHLKEWLQQHPGLGDWAVPMLAPYAQHVRLYAFG
jgi:KAP family P-loop domain